jgi:hypothetical protein
VAARLDPRYHPTADGRDWHHGARSRARSRARRAVRANHHGRAGACPSALGRAGSG